MHPGPTQASHEDPVHRLQSAIRAGVPARATAPTIPRSTVNNAPFQSADLPRLLDGYDICIDDHSYMPTDAMRAVPLAQAHRVLRHRRVELHGRRRRSPISASPCTPIRGYGDTAVAEHTIALMFACARDIALSDRRIRGGRWEPLEGVQLLGKTLGVIGLGGIGREVARIGRGIGMNVIGWNRTRHGDLGVPLADLDTLLSTSDVISLNLSLIDETRGFLDAARIARIKPGAILVNTARGALVDEAALIEALQSGRIRHAGLDVFHAEPLKADHPLAQHGQRHAVARTPPSARWKPR